MAVYLNPEAFKDRAIHPIKHKSEIINITYSELKSLINNSELIPGLQYRITDYVTTTTQDNTQSAGHQFDIIVIADDIDTLNCKARAIQHDEDTYFSTSQLEKWELWYDINNDTERYAWADSANGKGVIYRMIDEYNNDCPYDFKNIQFLYNHSLIGKNYFYTFSWIKVDDTIIDTSIFGNDGTLLNDNGQITGVYGNIIKLYHSYNNYPESPTCTTQWLNNILFISVYTNNEEFYGCYSNTFGNGCYSNTFGDGCYSNTFGNGCYSNTFGNRCYSNTFGDGCYLNTFGDGCYSNTFGNRCYSNTFGNDCYSNTFGYRCYSNTFGNDCYSNTFGYRCYSNTFGNDCSSNTFRNSCHLNTFGNDYYSNTFGDGCYSNTFGDGCYSNTFGNDCYLNTFGDAGYSNTFGNGCYSNTFGNRCYSNTFGYNCCYIKFASDISATTKYNYYTSNHFGDRCKFIVFTGTATASSSQQVQNYNFAQGLQGTSSVYLTINGSRNRNYETKIGKDSSNAVKEYCIEDLVK